MHFFQQILYDLKIRHTVVYARPLFEAERNSGSLVGIKRLLTHYGVKVSAVYAEDHQLEGLPYPIVISHRGWPIVLTQEPKSDSDISREWDGYALLCDASKAHEPHYLSNVFKQRVQYLFPRATAVAGLLVAIASLAVSFQWERTLLALLSGIGFYFSLRSVQGECAGSCSRVTSSAGGKLLGLYPLSVAGAAWFVLSTLVWALFPSLQGAWSWASLAMLVMPVWSIAYQALVVHAWCRNCLAVQGVVVASAALILAVGLPAWNTLAALVAAAAWLVLFYVGFHTYVLYTTVKKPSVDPTLIHLMSIPTLREEIIRTGSQIETSEMPFIDLGGDGRELVTVLSLHCTHCRDLFRRLYPLWQEGKLAGYHWKLVLSTYKNDTPMAESLVCTARQQGAGAALELLAEWYDQHSRKHFEKLHQALAPSEEVRQSISAQSDWIDKKRISSMPTLIFDGHVLAASLFEGMIYI